MNKLLIRVTLFICKNDERKRLETISFLRAIYNDINKKNVNDVDQLFNFRKYDKNYKNMGFFFIIFLLGLHNDFFCSIPDQNVLKLSSISLESMSM